MPNLFSDLPVAILAWVLASTSGFTRIVMGATSPQSHALLRSSATISGSAFDVELADATCQRQHAFRHGSCPHRKTRSGPPAPRPLGRAGILPARDHIHPCAGSAASVFKNRPDWKPLSSRSTPDAPSRPRASSNRSEDGATSVAVE